MAYLGGYFTISLVFDSPSFLRSFFLVCINVKLGDAFLLPAFDLAVSLILFLYYLIICMIV
jgi:hypothetical protein